MIAFGKPIIVMPMTVNVSKNIQLVKFLWNFAVNQGSPNECYILVHEIDLGECLDRVSWDEMEIWSFLVGLAYGRERLIAPDVIVMTDEHDFQFYPTMQKPIFQGAN